MDSKKALTFLEKLGSKEWAYGLFPLPFWKRKTWVSLTKEKGRGQKEKKWKEQREKKEKMYLLMI